MAGTPDVLSGTFAGRYTIERELGRGATATVYLARDAHRGISVAIKVLRHELAQSLGSERFLREIRVNEKLHHPHIVRVLDSGECDGQLYFVLPHMEGGSLRVMLAREKQLPIEVAVSITRTIADALDYAHREGLIHRDVKPENILFTSGQACLADFGIARAIERAIDESTTETGLVRGTPAYMSPEQASGSRDYDGRSDQYSLACVLYEMIAGVPAFMGATPEVVIAMRFLHPPRELRVFRPTVPAAIEAVISQALSLSPADRFPSAQAFSSALALAPRTPTVEARASATAVRWSSPRKLALAVAAVFAATMLGVVAVGARVIWGSGAAPLDTTRYLVLPVEGDSTALSSRTYDEMLQALGRWKGVTVVDRFAVRNALGRDSTIVDERLANRVARETNAGRLIRSRLASVESGLRLYTAVFDATDGRRLHEASASLPVGLTRMDSTFHALASAILLRGEPEPASGSRVLPAVQLFNQGLAAREAFDLRGADSLFLAALDHDRRLAEAALALAQVRTWNWRRAPASRWQNWAELAATEPALTARQKLIAEALVALARGEAERACRTFERLATDDERDFSLWYSLASCRNLDTVVVRDRRSPSGWRFRSSYQQAIRAYTRAFELAPTMHRTFQAGGYRELRKLLFTDAGVLRPGVAAAPDTGRFYAYPTWSGDSLLFVPYPQQMIVGGQARTDLAAVVQAGVRQRELFARIARSWASALPNNSATKEAVAISLDMFGSPAALDTLQAARRLAINPGDQLSLAADEVFLRLSLGRHSPGHLEHAVRLADSLTSANSSPDMDVAKVLAPVVAAMGRCRLGGGMSARATNPSVAETIGLPASVYLAAESLSAFTAIGCRTASDTSGLVALEGALRGMSGARPPRSPEQIESFLLWRTLRLSPSLDSTRVERYALDSPDYLLRAKGLALRGRRAEAGALLQEKRRARGPHGGSAITPDVIFAEALVLLAVGDTAAAHEWLDPLLSRPSWLQLMFENPVGVGALMNAVALRAELAYVAGDTLLAAKWSSLPATMWTSADPELRPVAKRMRQLSGQ